MLRQNQASAKAGEILLSFGSQGSEILWRLWFHPEVGSGLRTQILRLLTDAGTQKAERLAFLAFLSAEESLLKGALYTAEKLDAKGLWGNVTECLKNPNWRLRGKAVQLVGTWDTQGSRRRLEQMGVDPDPWVEEERQKALTLLSERKS